MAGRWVVTARNVCARGKRRFVLEAWAASDAVWKAEQALLQTNPRGQQWYISSVRETWGVRALWALAVQTVSAAWYKGSDRVRELIGLRERDVFAEAFDAAMAEQEKKIKALTLLTEYWDGTKEEKTLQHPTGKARWFLVYNRG